MGVGGAAVFAFSGVEDFGCWGGSFGMQGGWGVVRESGWKGLVVSSEERRRESKKLVQKDGIPHWQHTQEREVLARASKTWSFMPRHFLWVQMSHWSHCMLICPSLQGAFADGTGELVIGAWVDFNVSCQQEKAR